MNDDYQTTTWTDTAGNEWTYFPPGWYLMRQKSHTIPQVIYEDRFWMTWDPDRVAYEDPIDTSGIDWDTDPSRLI